MTRPLFSLFQSHLDLSHAIWQHQISKKNPLCVIDATMGNGHDTLFLASCLFPSETAELIALDIEPLAKLHTEERLKSGGFQEELSLNKIKPMIFSHDHINEVAPSFSVSLIVYNLGYLPGGGNKEKTTYEKTTIESVLKAEKLIEPGGLISITCYPGHVEGKKELDSLIDLVQKDPFFPHVWNVTHHITLNRAKAPSLLLLQKKLEASHSS